MTIEMSAPAFSRFHIGFDDRDKGRVFDYWEEIFATQKWSDGRFTRLFEQRWEQWNGLTSLAMSSWAGGAMAALEYFNVRGRAVLCPTNTFIATPLSVIHAGGQVVFGDCRRDDLCLSFEAVQEAASKYALAAVWLVHIGGHIAFDAPKIAEFCRKNGITLLEDCAHAHGASWDGRKPGQWGDAGVYSFYATKSLGLGEGGMLVSQHAGLIDFAKRYRAWGKPDCAVWGSNHRMTEWVAALGAVQAERIEQIVRWKNEIAHRELDPKYPHRVRFPSGMVSGYYKYIVFEPIEDSATKVYPELCHRTMKRAETYPNSEWIASNHWCVPLYYNPTDA